VICSTSWTTRSFGNLMLPLTPNRALGLGGRGLAIQAMAAPGAEAVAPRRLSSAPVGRKRCRAVKETSAPAAGPAAKAELRAPASPQAGQARRHCVEARLYRLLRRVAPTVRRGLLLRKFTESQRLALERWILTWRPSSAAESKAKSNGSLRPFAGPEGTRSRAKVRKVLAKSGVRGIESHFRGGRLLYRASATAGPFRLQTGYVADLSDARRLLEVVLSISARVGGAASSASSGDDGRGGSGPYPDACSELGVEARFRAALAEEPRAHGLDASTARQLRFFAVIPARVWVGAPLKTPCRKIEDGLEAGLSAWRRLSAAANATLACSSDGRAPAGHRRSVPSGCSSVAWARLRGACLETWGEAGFRPQRIVARLRRLEMAFSRLSFPAPCADCGQELAKSSDTTGLDNSAHAAAAAPTAADALSKAGCSTLLGDAVSLGPRGVSHGSRSSSGGIEREIDDLLACWARREARAACAAVRCKWQRGLAYTDLTVSSRRHRLVI